MTFVPQKRQPTERDQITLPLDPGQYTAIKAGADKHDISMKDFCRQAIEYALKNMP